MAYQRPLAVTIWRPAAARYFRKFFCAVKRKFSDRLRSEIGRPDAKDIVTDSRGRLT